MSQQPRGEMVVIGQLLRQGPRICKSPESAGWYILPTSDDIFVFISNPALAWLGLENFYENIILCRILISVIRASEIIMVWIPFYIKEVEFV